MIEKKGGVERRNMKEDEKENADTKQKGRVRVQNKMKR